MPRFTTLLQREWMQHHRAWLILILAAPALGLVVLLFANRVQIEPREPLALMLGATAAVTLGVLAIAWLALGFQASGLARRDEQDRSIEFWLSLPTSHAASIGATLLYHALLMPLLALGLGFVCSQVLGLALVSLVVGPAAAFGLPWGHLLAADAAGLARLGLGVLLATLWVLPLLLLVMASAAWLKRWGVPALVAALLIGHALLGGLYGITIIGDTLQAMFRQARQALVASAPMSDGVSIGDGDGLMPLLEQMPQLLAGDAAEALRQLADPLMLFGLLLSAACFGLLVLRRRQGR